MTVRQTEQVGQVLDHLSDYMLRVFTTIEPETIRSLARERLETRTRPTASERIRSARIQHDI